MSVPKLRERDIELACTQLLQLDGWRALKTDPCSDRWRGKGFGERGMADCLYLRYDFDPPNDGPFSTRYRVQGQILWVEWKRPRGRVAPHQVAWHMDERARGALTLIAGENFPATVEGFLNYYRKSGLMRRPI